jgi:hypothetical protein
MARAILLAVALAAAGAAPLALAQSQSNVPIWDTPPPPAEPATPPAAQPATTPPPAATPAPAFPLPPPPSDNAAATPSPAATPAPQSDFTTTQSAFPAPATTPAPTPAPAPTSGSGFDMSSPQGSAPAAAPPAPTPAAVPAPVTPSLPTSDLPPPTLIEPRLGCPAISRPTTSSDETTPWYKPTDADGDLAWNRIDPWEHASSFSVEGFWGSGASDYLLEYESIHGGMFSFFVGEASTPTDLFIQVGYLVGVGFQFVAPIRIYDFKQPDIQLGLILPEWRIGLILDPNTKFYGLWTSLVLVGLRATFFDIVKLEVKLLQPGAYMEGDFSNVAPNPQLTLGLSAGLGAGADLGIVF